MRSTTGQFKWGGQNFFESAQNVTLNMEGSVPVLHAGLRNERGMLVKSKVNLSEHIGNRDASFLVDPQYMHM